MTEAQTMRAEPTLANCPFCGGAGFWQSEHDADGFGVFWAIRCRGCGCGTQQFYVSHGNDCPQFRAEIRDAWNRRTPQAQGWRGIETAPKGEWVLIAGPASRTSATAMVAKFLGGDEWESADDGQRPYLNPTHWMSLPEPPGASPAPSLDAALTDAYAEGRKDEAEEVAKDAARERKEILDALDEYIPPNGNAWDAVNEIRALIAKRGEQ